MCLKPTLCQELIIIAAMHKKRIVISHWNLTGLISKHFGNKLELKEVFNKIKQIGILGVSETHLLPEAGHPLDTFRDFNSFRKAGKRRNYGSGGISVYMKNNVARGISVIHGESPDPR